MGFDPDKFLDETAAKKAAKGFNPDQFLADTDPSGVRGRGEALGQQFREEHNLGDSGYLPKVGGVQSALNNLPAAGTMMGEMAGGGIFSIPAGAAGGMIGTIGKRLGEQYILGKKPEEQEDLGNDLKSSVVNSGAQMLIGKGMGLVGNKFGLKPSENAPQVEAAGKKLGVTPTPGMLTDNDTYRNQEDSLSQSPTIAGQMMAAKRKPVFNAMQNAAEGAVSDSNKVSPFEAGRQAKKSLVDYIQNRYEPLKQDFQDIQNSTQNVNLNEAGRGRIAKNIGNIDEARFSGSPGEKVASQFQGWLGEAQSVDDIANLRTKAQRIAANPQADPEARAAASQIFDKLDQFHNNSIKRGAVDMARGFQPGYDPNTGKFIGRVEQEGNANAEGMAAGRDLLQKIGETRKGYGQLMNDINPIGKNSGLFKPKAGKGPQSIINEIESPTQNPNQSVAPSLFDPQNIEGLRHLQDKNPASYEIARQQELNSIVEKASGPDGKVNPSKLQRVIGDYDPEVQQMLFGNENVENLKAAKTLQQSMPRKTGQSGTPEGLGLTNILDLVTNVKDAGRYGLLKAKAAVPRMQQYSPLGGFLVKRGLLDGQ